MTFSRRKLWELLAASVSFPITILRTRNHHVLARAHCHQGAVLTLELKGEFASLDSTERLVVENITRELKSL